MSTPTWEAPSVILATKVEDAQRINTLPKHFGRYMAAVESLVYQFTRRLVREYHGGYWNFYELSNGGFYMAPDREPMAVWVEGNSFEGTMSADALGVTVCLFAFSHGSFRYANDPSAVFARHFELLREFSYLHPEGRLISAAID